jgi:hypothetical protein
MSLAIRIACRRSGLTRAELCGHIKSDIDFCDDHEPRPKLIQFWRADRDVVEGTVSEVIEQHLAARHDPKSKELAARLNETQLLITIRLGFGGDEVARPVWDMLSCVETCIAGDHDGVVIAAEGIYDAGLEPLLRF